MKKLPFILLAFVSLCVLITSKAKSEKVVQCDPLTFRRVSTQTWDCIKGKMREQGFNVPMALNGELTSSYATADFTLNPDTDTLSITIKSNSYSCSMVTRGITEMIDKCRDFEEVKSVPSQSTAKLWRIDAPNVKQRETAYRQITFKRGDTVKVTAGGCVQHGGPGKTWALYVDPVKVNPTPDFYGMIQLPGMATSVKLKDFLSGDGTYTIPNNVVGDMFLKLGFTDFRYEDNGYWGRQGDDGYNNQCKDQPNAWVEIAITH